MASKGNSFLFCMNLAFEMAFLNPPSAPLFQRGERGDFCRCLAQKGDVEKYGGFFKRL
jgi:hypothetical protein